MRKRLISMTLIILSSLALSACQTNTPLDALVYPSADYWDNPVNEQTIMLCNILEAEGYQFEEFDMLETGVEVLYPDGHQQRYPRSVSLTPVVITYINRDYNSFYQIPAEEAERLDSDAATFCHDYHEAADANGITLDLSGVFYWDWVNGVRGGYWFSETCEITGSYGWSTGSYAHDYEYFTDDEVCPSGHVIF